MADNQTYCIDCDVFLSDGEPCLYSGPSLESPNKGCRAGRPFATPGQARARVQAYDKSEAITKGERRAE